MSEHLPKHRPYRIIEGDAPFIRRRIVTFRRIEPGDLRTEGSVEVPESPFIEAKLVDIEVPESIHEKMKRLADAKAKALEIPRSPLLEYEPAGIMISAAGGIAVGVWLEYLMPQREFLLIAACLGVVGVLFALMTKRRRLAAEAAARARWDLAHEKDEYEAMAHEVTEKWRHFAQELRSDTGFHVEIRIAEGSRNPMRLASIDPRPMEGTAGFDPEDFLPTEGGGVRYEAVHAAGVVGTRLIPNAIEIQE